MLLAARQNWWGSGGGGIGAINYNQEDLVALFDGIENAGWETHGTSTTEWADLKGGNPFTGKVTEVTAIGPRSNGIDARNNCMYVTNPLGSNETSLTMEVCFTTESGSSTYWCPFSSTSSYSSRFQLNAEGNLRFHPIPSNVYTMNTGVYSVDQKKGTMTIRWNGSVMSMFWNGVVKNTISFSSYQWASIRGGGQIAIFDRLASVGQYIDNELFKGVMHCIRLYKRAITDTEIGENYLLDQQRFGL